MNRDAIDNAFAIDMAMGGSSIENYDMDAKGSIFIGEGAKLASVTLDAVSEMCIRDSSSLPRQSPFDLSPQS